MCTCKYCGKEFDNKQKLGGHISRCKLNPNYERNKKNCCNFSKHNGFKTINIFKECYCQYCGKLCHSQNSLIQHEIRCKKNPNKIQSYINTNKRVVRNQYTKAKELNLPKPELSEETRYKMGSGWRNKYHTEKQKEKISESMKLAHLEGRAHNIGESRWNSEPSYPEKWFMKVIENEFNNKNYVRELPFHRFSLDFAWIEIKKCIEIDGEQHERFEICKQRDLNKDTLLKQEGWEILRIPWSKCYHDPKEYIKLAKNFIDN